MDGVLKQGFQRALGIGSQILGELFNRRSCRVCLSYNLFGVYGC